MPPQVAYKLTALDKRLKAVEEKLAKGGLGAGKGDGSGVSAASFSELVQRVNALEAEPMELSKEDRENLNAITRGGLMGVVTQLAQSSFMDEAFKSHVSESKKAIEECRDSAIDQITAVVKKGVVKKTPKAGGTARGGRGSGGGMSTRSTTAQSSEESPVEPQFTSLTDWLSSKSKTEAPETPAKSVASGGDDSEQEGGYSCECGLRFRSELALGEHMSACGYLEGRDEESVHSDDSDFEPDTKRARTSSVEKYGKFKCPHCEKRQRNVSRHNDHISSCRANPAWKGPFWCPVTHCCRLHNKKRKSRSNLRDMRKHLVAEHPNATVSDEKIKEFQMKEAPPLHVGAVHG